MTVVRSRAQGWGSSPSSTRSTTCTCISRKGYAEGRSSAGIGMCTALVSALTKIPVRSDVR